MTPDSYYFRLVSGRQSGPLASVLRAGLAAMAAPYAGAITLRNAYYQHIPGRARRAAVPVVSVGNLVTGGTGKTPMVIWIVQRLIEAGRCPAVLMRGYKTSRGGCCQAAQVLQDAADGCENDEAREIRRRCPQVNLAIDPNRLAGARRAVAAGCDVLVMDDGFQHRRLARDLDVVLIDATNPFGWGVLPRGLRREPVASLRRADVIIVTRADQVPEEALTALKTELNDLAEPVLILLARHAPIEVCDQRGRRDHDVSLDSLRGRSAWVFAGVGNPNGFITTLEQLGVTVVGHGFWPDHHTWTDDELDEMARQARRAGPELVLTTEKDAVKLPPDRPNWPAPLRVVRVGIDFLQDDASVMQELIGDVTGPGQAGGEPQE